MLLLFAFLLFSFALCICFFAFDACAKPHFLFLFFVVPLAQLAEGIIKTDNQVLTKGFTEFHINHSQAVKHLINHVDSLKVFETSQDVWKEGLSCLSSGDVSLKRVDSWLSQVVT